jgi:hypothetical protein
MQHKRRKSLIALALGCRSCQDMRLAWVRMLPVASLRPNDSWPTNRALLNSLSDVLVAVIEAPREATHNLQMWFLCCCINNVPANLDASRQRLLAQDMEILFHRLKSLLSVHRSCSADHDGF